MKGHYNRPECRVDYGDRTEDGRPKGGIRLNHGACDMDRQRMVREEVTGKERMSLSLSSLKME